MHLHAALRVELIAAAMYTLLKYGSDKTLPPDAATTVSALGIIAVLGLLYKETHQVRVCSRCKARHSTAAAGFLSAAK